MFLIYFPLFKSTACLIFLFVIYFLFVVFRFIRWDLEPLDEVTENINEILKEKNYKKISAFDQVIITLICLLFCFVCLIFYLCILFTFIILMYIVILLTAMIENVIVFSIYTGISVILYLALKTVFNNCVKCVFCFLSVSLLFSIFSVFF